MPASDEPSAVAVSIVPRRLQGAALADCQSELAWRRLSPDPTPGSALSIRTARWKTAAIAEPIAHSSVNTDHFVAAVVLAPGNAHLRVDGLTVHDGTVLPGLAQVTAPMQETHAETAHATDVFHLFIPPPLIEQACGDQRAWIGRVPRIDPVLLNAVSSWIEIQGEAGDNRALYAECLGHLMLHRIAEHHLSFTRRRPPVGPLQSWRLRRAIDYVEANLGRSVSLKGMAAAAGLSTMHFAAQFRLAMGTTPYRYVVRRRIECAQHFIRQNDFRLGEIAMMTGFSSQAHFSSAFRATVGTTPRQWRESVIAGPAPKEVDSMMETAP